ncbi:hypothetical protein U6A24_07490 [Aquimarina gracilis]|uniref:DoxX-like protein n=1 Tax=Aquimarina gracilis TaxID=874422 RepID=A0ABU5ZTF9_9FLAO|nr:hypothetical protein [Aquimarina gracilis]MEB3345295.1 hypothetical protein [Aquimarina gracilis]
MEVTQDISKKNSWNAITLISFRFFFAYLFLNIFPFPLYYVGSIVGVDDLFSFYYDWFQELTVWTGKVVLGIDYEMPTGPNGSGDTTTDYVFQFVVVMIAIFTTIIWSFIDRRRQSYNRTFLYLRTFVRYYVAFTMFSYGFYKVIPLQFSELSNFDLIKTVGNQSPMGLMWNFMEYSDTYTRFSGFAEVIAGTLLLYRRTIVLGSILTIAVMFNVFMMNMSYDIPVKLYSGLLTIMGIFLLAPDIKRTLDFFILNKAVNPKIFLPYTTQEKAKKAINILKIITVLFLFYYNINDAIEGEKEWGKKAPKPALYGIYEVGNFIKNGDTIPPLTTDTIRWKRFIIGKRSLGIQTMDEKIKYFQEKTDTIAKTLQITNRKDSTDVQNFTYKFNDSLYTFQGIYKSDTLKIQLKKKERKDFLLISRGFHWINEYPFNR